MRRLVLIGAVVAVVTATRLLAQTSLQVTKAAETITQEDVARRVGIIADDSMMGRGTPSRGLEMTAQYVADQFKKFGLKPAGDRGTWFQRYPPIPDRYGTEAAPNTVGILEGTDPKLKHEYIVFGAHMDHVGFTSGRGQADSIYNGADDNASGTAGILELAEAFSQKGARPRRSLIFVTFSGEEKGLWGSFYFVEHPPVPLQQIVTDINLDMIGRKWEDTIVVHGMEDSDLGALVGRVAAAHAELHMTVRAGWGSFYPDSDHFPFARRGIPILYFDNERHGDYHKVTDSPEKIGAEKEARILRLVFYTGQEIANADARPQMTDKARQQIAPQ